MRRFHNSTRLDSTHCSHLLSANLGNYVISLGSKTCLDSALHTHTHTHWDLGTPLPHPLVACRRTNTVVASAFAFPCDIAFHGNFLSPATTFDLSNEAATDKSADGLVDILCRPEWANLQRICPTCSSCRGIEGVHKVVACLTSSL